MTEEVKDFVAIDFDVTELTQEPVVEEQTKDIEAQSDDATPHDEQNDDADDTGEDEEEHDDEKPQDEPKRKPRALREKEKRLEAQVRAAELEKELAIARYQAKQYEEALGLMKKTPEPTIDVDAELRAAGIDPDTVIDKDAIAAVLRAQNSGRENVQRLEQQRTADNIKLSLSTAQSQNPDFMDAIQHYAAMKSAEAKASAEALGIDATDNDIQQAVVIKTQEILLNAYRAGKDPAQAIVKLSTSMGFKSKPRVDNKNAIDYDKLTQLRDAAGKPPYKAESPKTVVKTKVSADGVVDMDW
jgi:hypothetical protein